MSFIGTFADLTGMKVGRFRVEELTGRDKAGAPRWKVVCGVCCFPQTLPHSNAVNLVQGKHSQTSLLCANPACPLSHQAREIETITDLRRKERRQAKEAEASAAEAQRAVEQQATKLRASEARMTGIKASYRTYWLHQIRTTIPESEIATLAQWGKLSEATRQQVLTACAADPTVQIRF
jgi:hypothetical protein